jgi:hypothetical protein
MRIRYLTLTGTLIALACSSSKESDDGGAAGHAGISSSAGSSAKGGSSATGGNASIAGTSSSGGASGSPTSGGNAGSGGQVSTSGGTGGTGGTAAANTCDACFSDHCDAISQACWGEPDCDDAQLGYDTCIASLPNDAGLGGASGNDAGAAGMSGADGGVASALGGASSAAPKTRADCHALAIAAANAATPSAGGAGVGGAGATVDVGQLVDDYLTCFEANCLAACN